MMIRPNINFTPVQSVEEQPNQNEQNKETLSTADTARVYFQEIGKSVLCMGLGFPLPFELASVISSGMARPICGLPADYCGYWNTYSGGLSLGYTLPIATAAGLAIYYLPSVIDKIRALPILGKNDLTRQTKITANSLFTADDITNSLSCFSESSRFIGLAYIALGALQASQIGNRALFYGDCQTRPSCGGYRPTIKMSCDLAMRDLAGTIFIGAALLSIRAAGIWLQGNVKKMNYPTLPCPSATLRREIRKVLWGSSSS